MTLWVCEVLMDDGHLLLLAYVLTLCSGLCFICLLLRRRLCNPRSLSVRWAYRSLSFRYRVLLTLVNSRPWCLEHLHQVKEAFETPGTTLFSWCTLARSSSDSCLSFVPVLLKSAQALRLALSAAVLLLVVGQRH